MRSSVASALTKHAPLKSETGHQMCTYCMLSLCCHSKPNPVTSHLSAPSCPFCRILTTQLVVANVKNNAEGDKNLRARISKRTRKLNEGSSSLKGLSSAISLFGRINGRGKLKVDDSGCSVTDKLWELGVHQMAIDIIVVHLTDVYMLDLYSLCRVWHCKSFFFSFLFVCFFF